MLVSLLVLSATGLWWLLPAKPASRLTFRFLGYAEGKPYAGMSPVLLGGQASAGQPMRVAQFSISNGNDFPVGCLLTVRYPNGGWGAFVPPNVQVASHTAANIIGVAVPTAGNGPPASYPSSPDWTRPWPVVAYASEASQYQGIRALRDKAMVWLCQHNQSRLGLFVSPRKVLRIETELIPPDSTSAQ